MVGGTRGAARGAELSVEEAEDSGYSDESSASGRCGLRRRSLGAGLCRVCRGDSTAEDEESSWCAGSRVDLGSPLM